MSKGGIDLYDCRILLATLYELVISQFSILVPVHVAEDFVHTLRHSQRAGAKQGGTDCTFSGVSSSDGNLTISPVILYIDCTIWSISS
jgi:hypothetical protein